MNNYEWEAIDEELYKEAGEKELVQVSKDREYMKAMTEQAERVIKYLREKYPERTFRRKLNYHEFGNYLEIEERIAYEDEADEDYEESFY